jgi:exopolyphosphatase/guanosine-5'-triphosphate,3'-diphosphate pyrophosphatase
MRLLIADVIDGQVVDVVRRMEVVRLGEGVDRTGRLDPAALGRAFAMAEEYARQCRELGVVALRVVATSATRDAANRDEFIAGIREIMGVEPEVVSGIEEAELALLGTVGSLVDLPAPYLIVDIGGGSTEFVLGTTSPTYMCSTNVGCVRIHERHLHSDPPTAAEIAAATNDIDAAFESVTAQVPLGSAATLVGTAGTVTSITAHALGLSRYDPQRVHGSVLSTDTVLAACAELLAMPRAERAKLGHLHEGRIDVIGAGGLVWSHVIKLVRAEFERHGHKLRSVVTSEHDGLDGITLSAYQRAANL